MEARWSAIEIDARDGAAPRPRISRAVDWTAANWSRDYSRPGQATCPFQSFPRDDKGSVAILAPAARFLAGGQTPPRRWFQGHLLVQVFPSCRREGADASPYGADTGREAAGSFWLNVVPLLLVGTRLSIARPTRREDAGIDGERMGTREREGDLILWMIVNGDERGWMREDFWEELFLGWRERKRGRFFLCSGFLVLWIEMRIYIYIYWIVLCWVESNFVEERS